MRRIPIEQLRSLSENDTPASSRTALALILTLLFAIALRIACFTGMYGSDDINYNLEAYHIATGNFESRVTDTSRPPGNYTYTMRVGVNFPTSLFFRLFGVNEITSILTPFFCSIGLVLLSFLAGRFFFDTSTGLIAAFLMSLLPLDVFHATKLIPDSPCSFWAGLCTLLFFMAEAKRSGRATTLLYTLSGMALAVSYLNKGTAVFIGLILSVYGIYRMVSNKRIKWEYLFCVAGFLIFFIPENLYYYSKTGHYLLRHDMLAQFNEEVLPYTWLAYKSTYAHPFLQRFFVDVPQMLIGSSSFGLLFWVVGIGLIYGVRNRSRQAYPVMFWFVSLLALYLFGSSSFTSYRPVWLAPRYIVLLNLPAILMAAFVLRRLIADPRPSTRKTRLGILLLLIVLVLGSGALFLGEVWVQPLVEGVVGASEQGQSLAKIVIPWIKVSHKVAVLLCLSLAFPTFLVLKKRFGLPRVLGSTLLTLLLLSSLYLTVGKADQRPGAGDIRKVHEFLGDAFSGTVYLDERSAAILEYFYAYQKNDQIRVFESEMKAEDIDEGALVVINRLRIGALTRLYHYRAPHFLREPPENWELTARFGVAEQSQLVFEVR